jgi:magnesium transporter
MFMFDEVTFEEKTLKSVTDIPNELPSGKVMWLDIDGNHDAEIINQLGDKFKIHPLVLADVMSDEQRTKLDITPDNSLFWILKMIYPTADNNQVVIEQVSLYLKPNILITFQEKNDDVFHPIRDRIRNCKGRVRKSGADYLFYALVDAIVDEYIVVLESIGDRIERLEESIMANQNSSAMEDVYDLKRELIFLRKSIFPLREIVIKLQKDENGLISSATQFYLKDLFDHVVQVTESIDAYREMLSSLLEMYMMQNSNAMNSVMKTLTIISTIFIPLTFIVGVYGMNFEYLPELHWRYAYFGVWSLMIVLALGMMFYFKRKKWF